MVCTLRADSRSARGPENYLDGSTIKRNIDVGVMAHDG